MLSNQVKIAGSDSERDGTAKNILAELKIEVKNFDTAFFDTGKDMRELYRDHAADSTQT